MTAGLVAALPRLALVLAVEVAAIAILARAVRIDRVTARRLALLGVAAFVPLLVITPPVAIVDYTDYEYFLHAAGRAETSAPVRPLFAWIARGGGDFAALVAVNVCLAASLPPLTELVARVAGGNAREARTASIVVMSSATWLVFATDANPVTPLAVCAAVAALGVDRFLADGTRAVRTAAFLVAAVASVLAFACREEGIFLAPVLFVALAAHGSTPRRERILGLIAWIVIVAAAHAVLARTVPALYAYLFRRVDQYSHRIAHQVWPFLAANAVGIALVVVAWHRRRDLLRAIASPTLTVALAYATIYANGAAAQEHQIVVLPLLAPHVVIAMSALRQAHRRIARVVMVVTLAAVALGTIGSGVLAYTAPKLREYRELRSGAGAGHRIFFVPYSAFQADPEAPLEALASERATLVTLQPPAGCPADLFAVLTYLHRHCVENHAPLSECRAVVQRAGGDWVDQAAALVDRFALDARDAVERSRSSQSKWTHAVHVDPGNTSSADLLFVPSWLHPSVFADTPAARFEEFRWFESVRVALDVPVENLRGGSTSLVAVRRRDPADATHVCESIRARPAGARLFAWIESGRANAR